ncbi:hypothetical protein [Microcoleus sp. AT3-D2]|uniref:hypothetical protein n=1 Tax=Microcoleus sp. AT3-D2 TaxID=2818612 RepID=UPI002FD5CCBD
MIANLPIKLPHLPNSLPSEGSVRIELVNGLLIFSASIQTQERIQTLTAQQQASNLTPEEQTELDGYREFISYLNLVNETMKNTFLYPLRRTVIGYDEPFEPAVSLEDWQVLE